MTLVATIECESCTNLATRFFTLRNRHLCCLCRGCFEALGGLSDWKLITVEEALIFMVMRS